MSDVGSADHLSKWNYSIFISSKISLIIYNLISDYVNLNKPHFGTTIGRVCNRINNGEFYLNGIKYSVSKNRGKFQLHGGFIGFHKYVWTSYVQGKQVTMTHVSEDGSEGYPGTVIANVTYELKPNNEFCVSFTANASKPTPINLTNHSYFNLAGHESGHEEIYKHVVEINADKITITDQDSIPTGEFQNLSGTNYDFRHPLELGAAIAKIDNPGFDDNYCVVQNTTTNKLSFIAKVAHPNSGRILKVYSDQPGVQFYTSNYLPDPENKIYPNEKKHADFSLSTDSEPISGKGNVKYYKHGGFCLETQKYPDSVNHSNFPTTIVNPLDTYTHNVIYKFEIEGSTKAIDNDEMKKFEYKHD